MRFEIEIYSFFMEIMMRDKEKHKKYCREYHKRHKEEILRKKKESYNREQKKEYYEKNKEKILENTNKYKIGNKEKIKDSSKDYRQKNKEKIKQHSQEYYQNNKKKIIESGNRYRNKRYKEDITFRIGRCVSSALNRYLRDNNLSKDGRHWESLVGYTSEDLKRHLESLFQSGMTWERLLKGDIHIDHIIPKSFFRYNSTDDVEFKYCWSLNNLQPLWAKDNLRKSNKLTSSV